MQELNELGIDISNAWLAFDSTGILTNRAEATRGGESFPTFTLQDILEMSPMIHLRHNIDAINENNRWEITVTKLFIIEHREFANSALLAAFNMLKWCKQNNYI